MTEADAKEIYSRWRKRTPCYLTDKFDKWFEGNGWFGMQDGWGRESTCGKYAMVVTEKSIRLIEYNK